MAKWRVVIELDKSAAKDVRELHEALMPFLEAVDVNGQAVVSLALLDDDDDTSDEWEPEP